MRSSNAIRLLVCWTSREWDIGFRNEKSYCVFSHVLLEMARKHTKSMKKRTHKKHRGGGWGFTGPQSIPGTPGTVNNAQVFTGIGDCRAVKPGYDIPYSQYTASFKGLPGMSGGKNTRKGRKNTRKQRGGRYGFYPEGDVNPSGQAWWAGSYAPVQRIACEGTTHNPLNPTHTGSSAPPGAASPNYYMTPGKGLMSGGAQLAPATYGVGDVDSMYYYAPTAGYANTASTWKDSVGAPVQIQVPFAARSMNQACLTTGGHPPLTGALQKGGKNKRTRNQRAGGVNNYVPKGVTNALGGVKNALGGLPALGGLFGTPAPAATLEEAAEVNAVAAKVNANVAAVNAKGAANAAVAAKGAANAAVNAAAVNAAIEEEEEAPPAVITGGKHKKKHHKKRTHRRRH